MSELLPVSVGVGLVISLLFSELFGLAAGGMVVPGYIALHLARPMDVAVTVGAGVVTYAMVHVLSMSLVIYGRRKMVVMILVGYVLAMLLAGGQLAGWTPAASDAGIDLGVIGFIIPGLIATWIDRQGLVETLSALLIAAVAVRLVLILAFGMELRA
jgi:poly-gamma-glutamate biosynthesis protein PgsC/CapC